MGASVITDEEFDEYVRANWTRLVRAVVLAGCSRHAAEDVVQSAFVRCVTHKSKVARADDLDAYVHRVVFNALSSARRRRWNRERPTETVPDLPGPEPFGEVDLADAVIRALTSLSQRDVLVLRYYAHLSENQIAEVLGIAPGTVKSRAARALVLLS